MVTWADDCSGASPISIVPATSVKRPRTLAIIRWRATNSTEVWDRSMFQLPAAGTSWASMLWVEVAIVMAGTFLSVCRNG